MAMADGAFNPFDQNQNPQGDGGEGEFPMTSPGTPKIPEMDVRTFGSDIKSMAEQGGGPPKPYQPAAPAQPATPAREPVSPPPPPAEKKSFGEVFETPGVMTPQPLETPPAGLQEFGEAPKSKRGLFVGLLVLIVVIGLGAVGYFYVYPTFFGRGGVEVPPPPVAENQPAPAPTPPIVPQVPVVSEETTTTTSTATTTGEAVPPAEETGVFGEHQSLFKTAADLKATTSIAAWSADTVSKIVTFSVAQVPVLKEVLLENADGTVAVFADMASALLPDVFAGGLGSRFVPDFTFFIYTNDKGSWPGFAARLKAGESLTEVKAAVAKLEASENLVNLFAVAPGSPTVWKSGTTEGVQNRYLTYGQAGASLNYGWQGDILVVGTSYAGFQEALKRLK